MQIVTKSKKIEELRGAFDLLDLPDSGLPNYSKIEKWLLNSQLDKVYSAYERKKDIFLNYDYRDALHPVKVKVHLHFSRLFNSFDDLAFISKPVAEPEPLKKVDFVQNQPLKPDIPQLEPLSPPVDCVQNQAVTSNQDLTDENKRRGRGKAKKEVPARSVLSVLVDDSDIERLNDKAVELDLTVSHLLRQAIKEFLKKV